MKRRESLINEGIIISYLDEIWNQSICWTDRVFQLDISKRVDSGGRNDYVAVYSPWERLCSTAEEHNKYYGHYLDRVCSFPLQYWISSKALMESVYSTVDIPSPLVMNILHSTSKTFPRVIHIFISFPNHPNRQFCEISITSHSKYKFCYHLKPQWSKWKNIKWQNQRNYYLSNWFYAHYWVSKSKRAKKKTRKL